MKIKSFRKKQQQKITIRWGTNFIKVKKRCIFDTSLLLYETVLAHLSLTHGRTKVINFGLSVCTSTLLNYISSKITEAI